MQHLILRPGPQLVMRAFRPEPDDTGNGLKEVDVTVRAHEHLFEMVTVHAETTLADIFRLVEASPAAAEVLPPGIRQRTLRGGAQGSRRAAGP
jgi:hypothetical protein